MELLLNGDEVGRKANVKISYTGPGQPEARGHEGKAAVQPF